jgi:hypothetical protein
MTIFSGVEMSLFEGDASLGFWLTVGGVRRKTTAILF